MKPRNIVIKSENNYAPKKIYAIDHGLVQAVRFSFSENYGKMLENIVYIALRRKQEEIYYYKEQKECDFIVAGGNKIIQAIQVTKSLAETKTKTREIDGLLEAMSKHKLKEGLILTEDESDVMKMGNAAIKVLPVWYWLLV